MNEEQNITQLPKGWEQKQFNEVAKLIRGVSYDKQYASSNPAEGLLPLIRATNIQDGLVLEEFVYVPEKIVKEEQLIKEGDILLAMSSGSKELVGKSAQAKQDYKIAFGTFCGLIRPNEKIDKKFFGYFFQTRNYRNYVSTISEGIGINNLRRNHIEDLIFPIPSSLEQARIVFKIEELFSEVDKGIEEIKTAQQQLKVYRQAVLKWAFEGKLTNKDVKEGELPTEWKRMRFGEVFFETPQNGLYKPSSEYGSGVPIIRIDGFYDGAILNDYEYKRVKLSEEETKKYLLLIGDILVNRVNSMSHLGKCGLVKSLKEQTVFESNIMKIRVKKELASPEYIIHFLSSKKGIKELTKNAKHAVNQASINQTDVSNAVIPFCLLEEQQQIVQEIESRLSVCDKIEETITNSLKQAEALRQSILKKAFEGKLV